MINPQRRIFWFWLFLLFFSFGMMCYGYVNFRINSFDGALIMLGLLLFVLSLIYTRISYKNTKTIDEAMRKGKNSKEIVHWKYTQEEWNNYLDYENYFRSNEKKVVFYFLSVFTIIVFSLFILFIPDGKFVMFLVMWGLILLYAFLGLLLPYLKKVYGSRKKGEIIILQKGIVMNKTYHSWDMPLSKLKGVKIVEKPFL